MPIPPASPPAPPSPSPASPRRRLGPPTEEHFELQRQREERARREPFVQAAWALLPRIEDLHRRYLGAPVLLTMEPGPYREPETTIQVEAIETWEAIEVILRTTHYQFERPEEDEGRGVQTFRVKAKPRAPKLETTGPLPSGYRFAGDRGDPWPGTMNPDEYP